MRELALLFLVMFIGVGLLIYALDHRNPKLRTISLPEEWRAMQAKDTMMMEERDDTIFLYFKHYCPQCKTVLISN